MSNEVKYPILPFISYGTIEEGGFYFTLPFRGVSLNQHKQFHHGRVKSLRGQYKSIIDLVVVASMKNIYIRQFDENGLILTKPVFDSPIDLVWILTFMAKNTRDVSNYTQKILLDSIVEIGMIEDDNSNFVNSDKTMFGSTKVDSITCLMLGNLHSHKFVKAVPHTKLDKIYKFLEVNT